MDGTEDKFAEIGEALLKLNEQLIGVAGDRVEAKAYRDRFGVDSSSAYFSGRSKSSSRADSAVGG